MKRLLYFSHGLSANGIETFLVNVLGKIDRNKYDITVIIAIDEGVECLHEKYVSELGIKVIHAGDMDSLKKKFQYIKNVKKLLSEEHYDIAHSNMDLLNGITLYLAKKAGIGVRICHAHTSKSQYKPEGALAGAKKLAQKIYSGLMKKLILSSSTVLLACSEVAGEYFYGKKPYALIYNGVNPKKFIMPENFDIAAYAKSLGFRGDEKHRIVSVGRLTDTKNPQFAVDVMAELKKIRNDFRYIWLGTGELLGVVQEKIKENNLQDTVILAGVRKDVPEILSCCDCFFMPSLFEGLPFSLVEAQFAGLKCAVSDIVTKTADTGLVDFFPLEKSAAEWAEFLSAELDKKTPERDEKKAKLFDISNTVEQLEEIYDKAN